MGGIGGVFITGIKRSQQLLAGNWVSGSKVQGFKDSRVHEKTNID